MNNEYVYISRFFSGTGNNTKLSQMAPALTAALYLSSEVTSDQDLLVTDIRPLLHLRRNHHL